MNRNYFKTLSSLLRQAAASADVTSLPLNTKFIIPTEAACLHSAADALFTATNAQTPQSLYTFRPEFSSIKDMPNGNKFFSTNQSSAATAMASNKAENQRSSLPESTRPDHNAVEDLMARADFITAIEYLSSKLRTMSASELSRLLIKLAFTGITSEGQFFTRVSPQPLMVDITIKPTLEYLEKIPGINLTRAVRNAPFLLIQSLPNLPRVESNRSWLTDTLNLTGSDLGKIVSSNGYVLYRPVEAMEACIQYLHKEIMGYPISLSSTENTLKVKSMVLRTPRMLALRVQKMESVVDDLKKNVGLVEAQIKTVFRKFPGAFMLSPDKIERVVHWLQTQGLGTIAIAATITRFPNLLSFSIAENLEPTRRFLEDELKLGNGAVVGRILQNSPDVFGRKIDTLKKHVESMKNAGFGGDGEFHTQEEQLKSFLMAYPGALRCDFSLPPYSTKLRFLKEELKMDLVPALVCNPMYISYGMERIAARAAFLKLAGRSLVAVTSWLSATESDFANRFAGKSVDEWLEFKYRWMKTAEAAKWLQ
ncbi:hypothetical protein Ndes2437B_g07499 [Nannochloris sp. 'desiccata']|nr:hypothetical protein KSW81_002227 [Chlorella desiccata (nom. nud.)]